MSRFKRTHITVKEEQIEKFIEYINNLESMLYFIKTDQFRVLVYMLRAILRIYK